MTFFLLILAICAHGQSWRPQLNADHARFWFYDRGDPDTIFSDYPDRTSSWGTSPARTASSREVLRTIWLPDSQGGVVGPTRFIHNPSNQKVYVINVSRNVPNIAVCDAGSGKLSTVINTTVRVPAIALSETSNKLYCANADSSFLQVIDCRTNQITGIIRLPCPAGKLVWGSANNEIYCTRPGDRRIGIIDCRGDSLVADLQIQASPSDLFYNPLSNKVYCSSSGGVDIIDAANHTIVQHLDLPRGNMIFTLNTVKNWLYCFTLFGNTGAVIDGVGDTLVTSMVFQPNSALYCADYNAAANLVYLGDNVGSITGRDACVYVIDGNTNQLIDTLRFDGSMVLALAYDSTDNRLFMAWQQYPYDDDWFADLLVVDCVSNTVIDTLEVGVWPAYRSGVLWERRHNQVWVANYGYANLPGYVVNVCAADSLVHRSRTAVGFTPYTGIINPATQKYYCIGRSDNFTLSFDLDHPDSCILKETGEAVWDILLNPLENKIYCANSTGKTVTVIDGTNDSIIKQVPIGTDADLLLLGLAFNRTDNKIYVASLLQFQLRSYITVIDGRTNNVVDTIQVPVGPFSSLWNSIDNKLYVASYPADTITIIDAHADTILTKIPAPSYPWSLVHNTTDDKIYCSVRYGTLVIDGATNQVIRSLPSEVYAFAYNPLNNKVYRGRPDGVLDIVDGASDSIIKTIQLQNGPYSLLYNPITNTIFCACLNFNPKYDRVLVVDGSSDEVLDNFTIPTQNWYYGYIGGVPGPSRYALVLDSVNNIVYLNHYSSSKISVIKGEVGIQDRTIVATRPSLRLSIIPNPALHHVLIEWSIPAMDHVQLTIYDIAGKKVKCVSAPKGIPCALIWEGTDHACREVPAGVYFCHLKTGEHSVTKKFVMLR